MCDVVHLCSLYVHTNNVALGPLLVGQPCFEYFLLGCAFTVKGFGLLSYAFLSVLQQKLFFFASCMQIKLNLIKKFLTFDLTAAENKPYL